MPNKANRKPMNTSPGGQRHTQRDASSGNGAVDVRGFSIQQDKQLLEDLAEPGYVLPFTEISACVMQGTQRPDHGVRVVMTSQISHHQRREANRLLSYGLLIDVYGSKIFQSLPYGLGYVASSFLPIRVSLQRSDPLDYGCLLEFTIAGHQLSRARVDQVLNSIVDNGDDPFVLELRGGPDDILLGFFPTKASLIQNSFSDGSTGSNTRFTGDLPHFKRKSSMLGWIQWMKCAVFFSFMSWLLLLSPASVLPYSPQLTGYGDNVTAISDVLPFCAENMTSAFKLGQLHRKVADHLETSKTINLEDSDEFVRSALREAEFVVGRPTDSINLTDLMNVYAEIEKTENHVSIITRVRGFFTFINIMWFTAICGIAAAILPSLYHLLYPFKDWWIAIFTWTMNEVLLPFVMRLHSYGFFEAVAYIFCFLLLADGFRIPAESGHYVAITGAMLTIPAASYSTMVWGMRIVKKTDPVFVMQIWCLWAAFSWTPLALHFGSSLVGFGVILALYVCIGFYGGVGRLCIFIGFRGHDETLRVAITSFVVVSLLVIAKIFNIGSPYFWTPFSCGISVMGSNMLFLSLLILCEHKEKGLLFNILIIFIFVGLMALGFILSLNSLSNTATTYFVIWLLQRYAMFHLDHSFNPWFLILIASTALWKISLYLHQHPQFIASIFSSIS